MNYIAGYRTRAHAMLIERGYRRVSSLGEYKNADNTVDVRIVDKVEELRGSDGYVLALGADSSLIRAQSSKLTAFSDPYDFFTAIEAV